jgi:iron-sulfur cluster insertion protein
MESTVELTDNAVRKVRSLVDEERNPSLKLRVFVTGGGCSGLSYGFTFDEEVADDDTVVEHDGTTLLVDPLSLQYLAGSRVDYREDLSGAQFLVTNPQAKTTCGCGNSFSV